METQQPQQSMFPPAPTAGEQAAPPAPPSGGAPQGYVPSAQSMEVAVDISGVDAPVEPGWYLVEFPNDPARMGIEVGPEVKTKAGDPKVVFKPIIICDINGDTSKAGRFAPWQHCVLVNKDKNPFGLVRILRQAFEMDMPKGTLHINFANLLGKPVWARIQPQEGNAQYSEIAEWKPQSKPPKGARAPGQVATPPAQSTGIGDRI